ncbi:hypothetical protein HDV04_004834 [Boothiomyces sp. JEL0838]|nr:hypothetical protein HDV04_004834 [Boothiomyces sp. JEL0838]
MSSKYIIDKGISIDGTGHPNLDIHSSLGIFTLVVMGTYMVLTTMMISLAWFGWIGITSRKTSSYLIAILILFFIWQIMNALLNSNFCTPFIYWFTNILGSVILLAMLLGQMEILKAFSPMSRIIKKPLIDKMMVGSLVIYIILLGPYWGLVTSLGKPPSSAILKFATPGLQLFGLLSVAFETFNATYVTSKLLEHQRLNCQINRQSIHAQATRNLLTLVIADICFIWLGVILFAISPSIGGSTEVSVSTISATIGIGHCLAVALNFKLIRLLNLKASSKDSKTSSRPIGTSVSA